MPVIEKVYNISYLESRSGLDTDEGIERCGGAKRFYYDELSGFDASTRKLLGNFAAPRGKKETLSDLYDLQALLYRVGEEEQVDKLEELITLVKRGASHTSVTGKLFGIRAGIQRIVNAINQSEVISGDENGEPVGARLERRANTLAMSRQNAAEAAEPAAPATAEPPADGVKMNVPVQSALFVKLLTLLEDFDFGAALKETRSLMDFSFTREIDIMLEHILSFIEKSDFKKAREEVKQLIRHAEKKEKELDLAKKAQNNKPVILAIDDVPDVLSSLKSMLRNDYNVYCVTNHLAALKFLSGNTPDLIFLDIEMPDMNGFQVIKLLRQMDSCKTTPVIFLTGNVSVENVKASIEAGGNDFLRKPVEYNLLVQKLRKHLHKPT